MNCGKEGEKNSEGEHEQERGTDKRSKDRDGLRDVKK